MKIYLLLILALILIPLTNAVTENEDLVYKTAQELDLKVPCINNNTYCSGSATCNLTIVYPNGSNLVNNQVMDNQIAYFNYSLSDDDTATSGSYVTTMICNDAGFNGFSTFKFRLSPSGEFSESSGFKIFIWVLFFVVAIGLFYTFILSLVRFIMLDVSVYDVLLSSGFYMLAYFNLYLASTYITDSLISTTLNQFISVFVYTNVLMPIMGFAVSFMVKRLSMKNFKWSEIWRGKL